MVLRRWGLLVALLSGCGVPEPSLETTGYVGDGGAEDGGADSCGRGFVVIETGDDYQSSNIALVGLDGTVLSETFATSATTSVGLAPPLSGDTVAPTMPQLGGEIALVDRTPASRIVWFDVATAHEDGRLDVGMGFVSNPHDYLRVSSHKAYVTRYDENPGSVADPENPGGDVLVLDPSAHALTGRIDLAPAMAGEPQGIQPRPDRLVAAGDRVFALLGPANGTFAASVSSRLVELDPETDQIVSTLVLDGLAQCTGLTLSPEADRVAVGCQPLDSDYKPIFAQSGIAVVDLEPEPHEVTRFTAEELGRPAGFFIEFASPTLLLAPSIGEDGATPAPDRLLSIDVETREVRTLLSRDVVYSLLEVRCACGRCIAADASIPGGQLVPLQVTGSGVEVGTPLSVAPELGPPRYVGRF